MSEFSVFYACPESRIPAVVRSAYGESGYPELEWRWVGGFHLVPLYVGLTGVSTSEATKELASVIIEPEDAVPDHERDPGDPEQWVDGYMVTRFPRRLVLALAEMNQSQKAEFGERWKQTLTARGDIIGPTADSLLTALCDLAVKAVQSGDCLIMAESGG